MHADNPPTFLLASPEPALLTAIEPVLLANGARVEIVLTAEAALAAMTAAEPPSLALLDANLTGMEVNQLLAAVRANVSARRLPIVLISDTVTQEGLDRLAEGAIDDLILRSAESAYWRLRIDLLLRICRCARELEALREAAVQNAQTDHLTGVYNRETILAMLFRETDRVQRMKNPLCMILFDIDDFGHWNSRLGAEACDDLLCQAATRTSGLLRTSTCWAAPAWMSFSLRCPAAARPTPCYWPSVCAWKSSASPSTWAANPYGCLRALALPAARAAPRWWCCARPNKHCNGPRPPVPSPSSAQEIARSLQPRPWRFYRPAPAMNCWRGSGWGRCSCGAWERR